VRTVYLCGAINGCSDAECKDWRQEAKAQLADVCHWLDPMRRDYRGIEDQSVEAIVVGDIRDIAECDIILAVADKPSWGTAMEIYHAFHQRKTVVVVCGQERVSPWLRHHSHELFPTLRQAIDYIKSVA
jgi:nucleoside 2-deoxyribosyltransferase